MSIKVALPAVLLFGILVHGQETRPLSLEQAVNTAWENSHKAKISEEQVKSAEQDLQVTKNKQYPDLDLSGTYLYLTDPNLDLKFNEDGNSEDTQSSEPPSPHHLLLGQASLSLPIYSGGKLKNAVKAGKNRFKASKFSNKSDKQEVALEAIKNYVALYKARKKVKLVKDNLKSAQRRSRDFSNMEKNELIARNDLLKVQLREHNVELSLKKAKKNARVLNYRLATFLQLPKNTKIAVDSLHFGLMEKERRGLGNKTHPKVQTMRQKEKEAEKNIDIEKGNNYPSVALTGGYMGAYLDKTLSLDRAFNIGVGVSYSLSDIFKNKSKVKAAESQAREAHLELKEIKDQVDVAKREARENYELAIKNYNVYKKSKEQADENFRIVKDKYENGLLETRDLLEADVQQLQSNINLATAKADITQKYYELRQAQGKLINEFSTK